MEQPLQERPTLGKVFPRLPEMKQSSSEARTPVCIGGSDQKFQCVAKVLVLEVETIEPLGMSAEFSAPFLPEHNVIGGMGAASGKLFAAFYETLQGVLPDHEQHEEAVGGGASQLLDQALIHHRGHAIEHINAKVAFRIAHCFDSFQRATAGKY